MNDRPIQESKGVSSSPPADAIRGKATMPGPDVTLVFLQTIENADIPGETDSFEYPHILPAGDNKGSLDFRINLHHRLDYEIFLVQILFVNLQKVTPEL